MTRALTAGTSPNTMVIGHFQRRHILFLRRELRALECLLADWLNIMPVLRPFGESVDIAVATQRPDDEDLRVLLDLVYGDEPEYAVRWGERELWQRLLADVRCALEVLQFQPDGTVPVASRRQVDSVVESLAALAVVAEHVHGGPGDPQLRPNGWICSWLQRLSAALSAASDESGLT